MMLNRQRCQNVPVWNGEPAALPPVSLPAASSRTAHPNNITLHAALPHVPSDTPGECQVDRMNGCRENGRARKTDSSDHS